ncbi:unnamed protein product, partial [Allacma fusca]
QLQQQLKAQSQQRQSTQYQTAPSTYSLNPLQSNPPTYYQAQSQPVQSQVNYQPQGFIQQPSQFHDHQHHQFHQSPIPVINSNTIRPETYVQPQNYFRPSLTDKFARPAETPKHVVQNPINVYDNKSPQLIPLSTIENVVRPNVYSPNRFSLPTNHHQHQPQHQVPQSSQQVNNFSQRPHGSPLNHPSHQFAIRSLENAEARPV